MPVSQEVLEDTLKGALNVAYLEILDTSSGCGENYSVTIVSDSFEGKTTLARHRMVNDLLKAQIAEMHAFSQKTYTPKQWSDLQAKQAAA